MAATTLSESKLNAYLIVDDIEGEEEALKNVKDRDGKSLSKIGDIYYEKKNYSKAIDWFRLGAAKDDVHSQYKLGYMYEHNKSVFSDYRIAMEWYLKAHDKGDARATNSIGRLYYYGKGVDENEHTALKWFLEAANKGDRTARCNVGFYYEYGRGGIRVDKKYALELYEQSAEKGYKGAKASIKSLNKEGHYIDVNQRRCIQLEKDMEEQKSKMKSLENQLKLSESKRLKADDEIRILQRQVKFLRVRSNADANIQVSLEEYNTDELSEAASSNTVDCSKTTTVKGFKVAEENPENDTWYY